MGRGTGDSRDISAAPRSQRDALTFIEVAKGGAFGEMLKAAPDVGDPKVVPCARRRLGDRRKVAEAARILLGSGGTFYVIRYRYFSRRRAGTLFDYEPELQEFGVAYEGDSPEEAASEMNEALTVLDGSGLNALSLESLGGGHVRPRSVGRPYSAEEISRGVAALA